MYEPIESAKLARGTFLNDDRRFFLRRFGTDGRHSCDLSEVELMELSPGCRKNHSVRRRVRGRFGPPTTDISVAQCMDINRQSIAHLVACERRDCKCLVGTMLHFYMSFVTCAILTRSKQ
jgi:hypothetical protein